MLDGTVTIAGSTVRGRTLEGATAAMNVGEFVDRLAPPGMTTGHVVIPDGVRVIASGRTWTTLVWELAPKVHRVRWISGDSETPYGLSGREAKYQQRMLALPYVVIVALFVRDRAGRLMLSGCNEAYVRNDTIKALDDELYFPPLLNISRFASSSADSSPLAWICTQYLDLGELAAERDENLRIRRSLRALRTTLLETGFNYSSEHHELTSYWSLTAEKVPEIADLDRWEAMSREDPLFALRLPWLPARAGGNPLTVRGLLERLAGQHGDAGRPVAVGGLLRLLFGGRRNGLRR